MPWFCATEIGCNLAIDPEILRQMRANNVVCDYAQKGSGWYQLTVTDVGKSRTIVDLAYAGESRWKQLGEPRRQEARHVAGIFAYYR
jgi:hypothetical protein